MTAFGVGVAGNLLASFTWYFIQPFLENRQAKAAAQRIVRAAFEAEVKRLAKATSADPNHVMDVLRPALPRDVSATVIAYTAAYDTASEVNPVADEVLTALVHELEAAGLDTATLPIDVRELLKAVPGATRRRLLKAAMRPSSPLFNRVSLGELSQIRETLDALYARLSLSPPPTDAVPVPTPPQPYFPHTFAAERNVGWRAAERQTLTDWWSRGHEPLLVLVAAGGLGKSSLAWTWLLTDVLSLRSVNEEETRQNRRLLWAACRDPPGWSSVVVVQRTRRILSAILGCCAEVRDCSV